MSHDDRDTTVCARAGDLSFAIQMPMQGNGAAPYLLEEVVALVIRGFNETFGDYDLDDPDEDEATAAPGDDAATG